MCWPVSCGQGGRLRIAGSNSRRAAQASWRARYSRSQRKSNGCALRRILAPDGAQPELSRSAAAEDHPGDTGARHFEHRLLPSVPSPSNLHDETWPALAARISPYASPRRRLDWHHVRETQKISAAAQKIAVDYNRERDAALSWDPRLAANLELDAKPFQLRRSDLAGFGPYRDGDGGRLLRRWLNRRFEIAASCVRTMRSPP